MMSKQYFIYYRGISGEFMLVCISKDVYLSYLFNHYDADFGESPNDKYVIFEANIDFSKIHLIELPPLCILNIRIGKRCSERTYGIKFIDDINTTKKIGYYYCTYDPDNVGIMTLIKNIK